MKKFLSILLCLFMLFGIVGCIQPGSSSSRNNVIVGDYEVLNDGKSFLSKYEWGKVFDLLDSFEYEFKQESYTPTDKCFVIKTKKNTQDGEKFITYYLDFYEHKIVYAPSRVSKGDTAYAIITGKPFQELFTIFSTASIRIYKETAFTVEGWEKADPYKRNLMVNHFITNHQVNGMTETQLKEYLGEPDLEILEEVVSRLTYLLYDKGDDNVGYFRRRVTFEIGSGSIVYGYYWGMCYEYNISFTEVEGRVFNQTQVVEDTYLEGSQVDIYTEILPNAELVMYIDGERANGGYETTYQGKKAWKYSFLMPNHSIGISFKIENENCMDVKTLLSIPKLFFEDIVKVRYEQGYVEETGSLGGYLNVFSSSSSSGNIANVLAILEYSVEEAQESAWLEDSGIYYRYSIFTKNDRYDIKISRNHIEVDGRYYTYLGLIPHFTRPRVGGNVFVTHEDSYDVFEYSNGMVGDCIGAYKKLAEVEFQYTNDAVNTEPILCIRTEFGDIQVLAENLFRNNDGVYKVINGINLLDYEAY